VPTQTVISGGAVLPPVPQGPTSTLNPRNLAMTMTTVVIWAVTFPLLKIALDEGVPPLTLGALRFGLSVPMLLLVLALMGGGLGKLRRLTARQWGIIAAWAMLSTTISNITQNIGMQWTSASVSSILQSSGPILGMFLAIMFLGERYTHLKLAGGVVATVGTVGIVVAVGADMSGTTVAGNALILASEISYVLAGIVGKYVLREVDPYTLMAAGFPIATVPLVAGAAFESPVHALAAMSATSWAIVAFLAVAPTTIAMLLWYIVLDRVEVGRLIYFVYLIPVVAIVASWAMLGETLAPVQVLFAAMVISGVMTAQRETKGPEKEPPDGKESEKR